MEGVSSPSTRALLGSYAPIGLVCAPFIRITDQKPSVDYLTSVVERESVPNLSVQLLGANAPHLAFAAQVLAEAGAKVIDLNFGCPSKQVMKKGVGAALLSAPDAIRRIVGQVRQSIDVTLSAKIRGGIDVMDDTLQIAKVVESEGVDFLTVHPRLSSQGYRGLADWRFTSAIKREVSIPVVGNGDVWYADDALRLLRWSGCDGVMLGRGCLRNPWIFRQIGELLAGTQPFAPTGEDLVEHLERLSHAIRCDLSGNELRTLGALKEQAGYLLRVVAEDERAPLKKAVLSSQSVEQLLQSFVEVCQLPCLDVMASGPLRLETSAGKFCDEYPEPASSPRKLE